MKRLLTEDDIKGLEKDVEVIRNNNSIKILCENAKAIHFSLPKEMSEYYQAQSLEEFEKDFRG